MSLLAQLGRAARGLGVLAVLTGATVLAANRPAGAEEPRDDKAAFNERCANRLSIAFIGKTASMEMIESPDPKLAIESLLSSADFRERFARFINARFNNAPGMSSLEDAPYHLAKKVLGDGVPWSEMFLGKYRLSPIAGNVAVFADSSGLGYFRSEDWYKRYEGNEEEGIKLATAYRIMNNVVGLELTATTSSPNSDQSATGRHSPACAGCHYDGWFALDKVAAVLPRRGQAFNAYKDGPKEMLGGKQIGNDKELVEALVESENFSVNACRLAFRYLYGRDDNRCEGPALDRCVDTFKAKKRIQSALSSIAREPAFCE